MHLYSDTEILDEFKRLGRACIEMEEADLKSRQGIEDPTLGEKMDEVRRLKNHLTQMARDEAFSRK